MFTQYNYNLKGKKLCFFWFIGSKKLRGPFLTIFDLRPVRKKNLF